MAMSDGGGSYIELAGTADFDVGPLRLRPSLREVQVGGTTCSLEPRVMQVLVALAERAGETVPRDELIARCWRGAVVSEDAVQRCIRQLRRLAESAGGFEIQTLTRVGYRLRPGSTDPVRSSSGRSGAATDSRPSIAFTSIHVQSALSSDQRFAEHLADEVTEALALNRDLQVIASGSALPGPSEDRDVRALGRETGVAYAASGNLRRIDAELRVTIRLAETAQGRIIWSHAIQGEMQHPPSTDLVIEIAARIAHELMSQESLRVMQKSSDLTAWESVVRSRAAYQGISLEDLGVAVAEARRAVHLDPNFGAAHAALANALAATYEVSGALDPALAQEARTHADAAVALDPDNPTVLAWAGNALGMATRPAQGFELAVRAVELAPAHWVAHLYLGRQYLYRGEPERALEQFAEHDRGAPKWPWQFYVTFYRAIAHSMAGRIEEAERQLARAAVMNPDYRYVWIAQAILYTTSGQHEAAGAAVRRLKALDGNDSLDLQLARIAHSYPQQESREALLSALREAWKAA